MNSFYVLVHLFITFHLSLLVSVVSAGGIRNDKENETNDLYYNDMVLKTKTTKSFDATKIAIKGKKTMKSYRHRPIDKVNIRLSSSSYDDSSSSSVRSLKRNPKQIKSNTKEKNRTKKCVSTSSSSSSSSSENKKMSSSGPSYSTRTQRLTFEARTTLFNVQLDQLTSAESLFFEDKWMEAHNTIYDTTTMKNAANNNDDHNKDMMVRSIVIEDSSSRYHNGHEIKEDSLSFSSSSDDSDDNDPKKRRQLLRSNDTPPETTTATTTQEEQRVLYQYWYSPSFYFDIWSLIEISCTLCSNDYRRLSTVEKQQQEENNNSEQYLPKPNLRHAVADKNNNNDKFVTNSSQRVLFQEEKFKRQFEILLCILLGEGQFRIFHDIEDCRVTYLSNYNGNGN